MNVECRLKSFTPWEGPVDAHSMSEAGFVYTGQEDLVYCFSCNIQLDGWTKQMDPLLRHKEESPTCSFVRQQLQGVKSVVAPSNPQIMSNIVQSNCCHQPELPLPNKRREDDCSGPVMRINYQSEVERIRTFVGWPLEHLVHAEQLARVGFVYTGEGSLVQCFQCAVRYHNWLKGDIPLNVHQRCNPDCEFLQTLRSSQPHPVLGNDQKPLSKVHAQSSCASNLDDNITISQCHLEFSKLVMSVLGVLQTNMNEDKALERCKQFCTVLCISDSSDELLFNDEQQKKIDQCNDFRELFRSLHPHWNWNDCSILKYIIELCESNEAEQEIKQYERKMALCAGLNLIFDQNRSEPPPGFAKFYVIVNQPYDKLTVEQYESARKFIFDNVNVYQYVAHPFIHVLFGSVHFHWHIKVEAVPHMIEMALQRKEIFLKNSYVFMQIGSNVVFDERQEWTQIHDQCHTSSDDHDINMESHPPPPRCVGEVSSSDFTSPRNSSVVPASLSFQSDSTGPWSQEQVHCGLQVLTDITLPSPCTEHDEYDSQVYYNFCGDHDTNMESHQLVPQSVSEEVNPHNSLVVMDNWSFQSDSMKLCSQEQVQLRNCGLPVLTDVTLPTEHHVEKHSRLVLMDSQDLCHIYANCHTDSVVTGI